MRASVLQGQGLCGYPGAMETLGPVSLRAAFLFLKAEKYTGEREVLRILQPKKIALTYNSRGPQ
jgi:hypothetical protein